MITLILNNREFEADFKTKIAATKDPQGMLLNVGREVSNLLKTHFRGKDAAEPNRLGGRRSHFWHAVSRTVQNPVVGSRSVSVAINHPSIAQKVFGGRIVPKRAKALTIPLTPEAYGKTAASFPGAFLLKTLKGAFIVKVGENILASGVISRAKRGKFKGKRAALNFLFKLVPFVDQDADPTALPEQTKLEAAVLVRAQQVLDHELKNPGAATV